MLVVAGDHVIEIRVDPSSDARSMVVSVELDYEQSWLFDEPGWQDLGFGVSDGVAYWWSARHLVILPTGGQQSDPMTIPTDEDIRLAFAVSGNWLLVCETSIRLVSGSKEVSRLEFGEVLLAARWEDTWLHVRDAGDRDIKVFLDEGRLAVVQ